ncbi:MAG: ArnT family glycosyltransferase [Nitrosotalea sp.]
MDSKKMARSFSMKIKYTSILFLVIPLVLSAFTHIWNPVGFPDVFYDEGIYMYRAMHVLAGEGLQTGYFHDHPFFGQIFLAGTLSLVGYPNSLHPTADVHSAEMLYLVPRVLMGILAVADTFLIYKISERRYSKNVALFASILFAVMPITWLTRRILLDSILLPFLLTSILFAIYAKDSKNKKLLVVLSGIFFGISVFTKETMFMMIPLLAVLVYQNTKSPRMLAVWFIPVILIPLIWPIQSIQDNQFHLWISDILYQVHRQNNNFGNILENFLVFDPLLLVLGFAGVVYAAVKKDWMILLWFVPFLVFLSTMGYVQYFYWIPVLPVLCIAAAKFIIDITKHAKEDIRHKLPFIIMACIGIFGLTMTSFLITSNVSAQFDATAYVLQNVHNSDAPYDEKNTTIVSSAVYSWIFKYVYHMTDVLPDYRYLLFYPLPTDHVLLVSDLHFKANISAGKQLQDIYNNTTSVKKFRGGVLDEDLKKYPFTNMAANYEGSEVEIRERN